MNTVHVFISAGRFRSFEEMRAYVEETYTEEGDGIPSPFAREVDQTEYEPASIECLHSPEPVPVTELLAKASYSDQWLSDVKISELADAAICVFAPNVIEHPEHSSLKYLGLFRFRS